MRNMIPDTVKHDKTNKPNPANAQLDMEKQLRKKQLFPLGQSSIYLSGTFSRCELTAGYNIAVGKNKFAGGCWYSCNRVSPTHTLLMHPMVPMVVGCPPFDRHAARMSLWHSCPKVFRGQAAWS